MKNFNVKFRLIFIPYLIISASTIIAYTLLRWLLFIKSNVMIVDEDVLNFWAPCFFVLIPVYFGLGPRIRILDLTAKGYRSNPFAGLLLLAGMTILAPTIVTQVYLETATGKLTNLDRISQVDSVSQTKFYMVKTFYADKNFTRFKSRFAITSKSSDFDMYIYAAVPMYNSNHTIKTYNYKIRAKGDTADISKALIVVDGKVCSGDTLRSINPRAIENIEILKGKMARRLYGENAKSGAILIKTKPFTGADTMQVIHDDNGRYKPSAWLAIRYLKTVSNRLSSEDKSKAYQQFAKESQADLNAKSLDKFIYLDRVPFGDDMKNYLAAINQEGDQATVRKLNLFIPVYESFDSRNGSKLAWIFASFSIGAAFFLFLLLFKPLRSDLEYAIHPGDKTQQIIDEITARR